MKLIILVLTMASMFCIYACKVKRDINTEPTGRVLFSLEKGPCFGKCPVFMMDVYDDGTVEYRGKNFTDMLGIYRKVLSSKELSTLKNAFVKVGFEKLKEEYPSELVDLPLVTIKGMIGKELKSIIGKTERPQELMQFQFVLERIIESGDWTLIKDGWKEDSDHNKPPEISFLLDEVIIEPQSGVLMAKWLDKMSEAKVILKKKIAPTLNYYLITYDQSVISPQDFLKLLNDDPEIKSAEFNKVATPR